MTDDLDLDALVRLAEVAHDEVVRLCQPDEKWRMSIPARPDRDSDLILSNALTNMLALVERLRAAESAVERVRTYLGHWHLDMAQRTADLGFAPEHHREWPRYLGLGDALRGSGPSATTEVSPESTADPNGPQSAGNEGEV